jgi:hypothetical protein
LKQALTGTVPIVHQKIIGDYCRLKNHVYDAYRTVPKKVLQNMMSDYKVDIFSKRGLDKDIVDSFLPCTDGGCQVQSTGSENPGALCNNLNVDNITHFRQGNESDNEYFKHIEYQTIDKTKDAIPPNCWWRNFGNSDLSSLNTVNTAGEYDPVTQAGWKNIFDKAGNVIGMTGDPESPNAATPIAANCLLPTPGNFQFNPSGEKLTDSEIWSYTFSPKNPNYKGCLTSLDCGEYITGPSAPSQPILRHLTNFDMFQSPNVVPDSMRSYGCYGGPDGTPVCHKSAAYDPNADPNFLFDCVQPPPSQCPPDTVNNGTCYPGASAPASPSKTQFDPDDAPPGYRYGSIGGVPGHYLKGVCTLKTQFPVHWNSDTNTCDYTNTLGKKWCMYPRTRTNTQPDPDDGKLASCVPPFEWKDTGPGGEGVCNTTMPYCDYFQRHFCADGDRCTYTGREGSPFAMGLQKTSVEGAGCYVDSADSIAGVVSGISADLLDNFKWGGQGFARSFSDKLGAARDRQIVYPDEMINASFENSCSLLQWSYDSDLKTCVMCEPNRESTRGGSPASPTPPSARAEGTCQGDNRISYGDCQKKLSFDQYNKETFTNDFRNNLQKAFSKKKHFYKKDITPTICEPLKEHFEQVDKSESYQNWRKTADVKGASEKLIVDTINKYGQPLQESLKNRHYLLVDEDAVFTAVKIQNHAFGEDIHLYAVRWDKDSKPSLLPLAKDLEKHYPNAIKKRKYKGTYRKFLKLTPNLLKKYPELHKIYATTVL